MHFIGITSPSALTRYRGPNSDSLFPPLAAVVVVAPIEGRPWHSGKVSLFARGSPTRGAGGRKPD